MDRQMKAARTLREVFHVTDDGHRGAAVKRFCPLSLVICASVSSAQSTDPLVQPQNLVYQGGFRVPAVSCSDVAPNDWQCFHYGGEAMTYYGADNSLYVGGHPYGNKVAEISIPSLSIGGTVSSYNTATVLQQFVDVSEGNLAKVCTRTPCPLQLSGLLVVGSTLVFAPRHTYDAGTPPSQTTSHFTHSLNLSTAGHNGPYRVGGTYPGWVDSYMGTIPSTWQAKLRGAYFTGGCCSAIASIQSNGPAAFVFDPTQLGTTVPLPTTGIVGYPAPYGLGGGKWNSNSSLQNGTTQIHGAAFPSGTRSLLFFGRQGVGPFCYGAGTATASLAGTTVPGTNRVPYCYDPAGVDGKGPHAYPYVYEIWAYDAKDLLRVSRGSKQMDAVAPYATWQLHPPFENVADNHFAGGVGYDSTNQIIYVAFRQEDPINGPPDLPVIGAYKISFSGPKASQPN
jgi:hypothetical protein